MKYLSSRIFAWWLVHEAGRESFIEKVHTNISQETFFGTTLAFEKHQMKIDNFLENGESLEINWHHDKLEKCQISFSEQLV